MALMNDWVKMFNYKKMQNLMSYLLTQNCESQVFAVDANANDVQTTGTKAVMINGQVIVLPADAAYDISAEAAYADWAVSTAYTTAGAVSEAVGFDGRHYVCTLAHTSYGYANTSASAVKASSNEPGWGDLWGTYWKVLDKFAVDAAGDTIVESAVAYYLACALYDGTVRLFKAYTGTASTTTALKIPVFDPERYVAIGLLQITGGSGGFVLGTTSTDSVSVFTDLTGPVFPDASLLDQN